MSFISNHSHEANIEGFTIKYTIIESISDPESDINMLEYGISCTAFNPDGTISSHDEVKGISPNFYKVITILYILKAYYVFPEHLKDIICDLLEELPSFETPYCLSA